jgi:hypothetical protein
VQIAPCVLFDTLTQSASTSAEETLRHVNIQTHQCGRVVPRYATRYSLSIITYDRLAPEKVPAGAGPQVRSAEAPAPADGVLQFPIPNTSHVAVIIDGYWVAAGTPVLPSISNIVTQTGLRPQSLVTGPGTPVTQALVGGTTGTAGDIYLDASAPALSGVSYANVGVAMISRAATPNIIATMGDDNAHGPALFAIYDTHRDSGGTATSSSQLMYVTGDAMMHLPGFGLFSGRTSYRELPAVPDNVVHDVSIINPRDASGGATSRVTFFKSKAEFDTGSPATTKYLAYSRGDAGQSNINFDSQIVLHNGAQYHFRAFSVADPDANGKDTFWVKAATNGDSITNTRADMWVSGYVGVGTPNPGTPGSAKLQVEDLNNNTELLVSAGDVPGNAHSPTMTLMRKDGNHAQLAKYGFQIDSADNKFKLLYGATGAFASTPLIVDTTGNATFAGNVSAGGVINAKYQDVAEWVPAGGALPSGTVVILNRAKTNEVTPSTTAYDTAVAGVVSDQPGVLLGTAGADKAKIATTGRVKVRVDATTHPVNIGDLLVTSDVPGTAMYSEPLDLGGVKIHRPGTLIGKALEPLPSGQGEILVLLSLQ